MNASQHCVLGDAKGLVIVHELHHLLDQMVFTLVWNNGTVVFLS